MLTFSRFKNLPILLIAVFLLAAVGSKTVQARTLLKNICRVKGQEQNTLRGLGLVVGLQGTGDSGDNLPTMRALARAMELMGNPLSIPDVKGRGGLLELKNTKNVALVWVTATIPGTGGRSGDRLNCSVSAISAKSLAGGRLTFAALKGPDINDPRIYGLSQGKLHLDDPKHATEATVHHGCQLIEDVFNVFQKDNTITLVLDKNHADFQVASAVTEAINSQLNYQGTSGEADQIDDVLATAIDPANIRVKIPKQYREVPVQFVAQVMELPIFELDTEARVVVNERAGTIVIGGDVEIGNVIVTHKNVTIKAGQKQFIPLDPGSSNQPKLQALVSALNSVDVPTEDIIEIIKGIERNGKLHGRLIIQ